jgi:hypothetical protein
MSMILGLTTLADDNIERVLADPALIWRVVSPDDSTMYDEARRASSPSFLGRLLGRKAAPASPAVELTLREGEGISTDLDKAWHGIHYLLTRTAWAGDPPWSFLVSSGRAVGDIDVGYGPARVFTAAETRSIHAALKGLTGDALRSRYDADDMTAKQIYPEIWSRDSPDEETIDYLIECYETLVAFLQQAVDAQAGIVVSLS